LGCSKGVENIWSFSLLCRSKKGTYYIEHRCDCVCVVCIRNTPRWMIFPSYYFIFQFYWNGVVKL